MSSFNIEGSYMNKLNRLALALLIVLVSACAAVSEYQASTIGGQVDATRSEVDDFIDAGIGVIEESSSIRDDLEEVVVPESAPWLALSTTAAYNNLSAKEAISALVNGRPVRYLVSNPDENPLVKNSYGARTIAAHLDSVMVQADWAYDVSDGVIVVTDTATEHFRILTAPGARVFSTDIDSLGSSLNGASVTSSTVNQLNGTSDPYESLVDALSSVGFFEASGAFLPSSSPVAPPVVSSSFSVLPAVGVLSVSGRPSEIRKAAEIVEWFNDAHSAKAVVEISVYEVDYTRSRDRQLDINLLRSGVENGSFVVSPDSFTAGQLGVSDISIDIVDPTSSVFGSSAILTWLNSHGETSLAIKRRIELTNNEMTTIENRQNNPFVESVSRDSFNTGATTSTAPTVDLNSRDTGWAMNILPVVNTADNEVAMRINMSRANLIDFFAYSFDEGSISGQVPIISSANDVLYVTLKDGQSKIVSLAEFSSNSTSRAGSPLLPLIGDNVNNDGLGRDFVMLVSAEIVR